MATLLALINEVLRRTGQTQATTLTNAATPVAQAVDFLNEAYTEMLQRLKVNRLQRQATFNTVAGTASYSLSSLTEVNALVGDSLIETGNQVRLQEVNYTWPLQFGLSTQGRPEVFYRQNNQITLHPIPNAVYTIQYGYFVKPQALTTDAATTDLPAEWEKVLVLGTQARLEHFLGEGGESSWALYRDGLAQLRARAPGKPHARMQGFYRGGSAT